MADSSLGGEFSRADAPRRLAGGAAANLWELTDGLYLVPGVFYSTAEQSEFGVDLKLESLALGAEVRYFLDGEPRGFYSAAAPT
jgi:hypothetical protein